MNDLIKNAKAALDEKCDRLKDAAAERGADTDCGALFEAHGSVVASLAAVGESLREICRDNVNKETKA